MKVTFTKLDLEVAKAWREFRAIMESDIRSALGEPVQDRKPPSEAALAVYDELVRQEEISSDLNARRLSDQPEAE